jgi:uncharacterized protein
MAWWQVKDGITVVRVRVSAGASKDVVEGEMTDAQGMTWLKIRVVTPPEKGKANAHVRKLLAKHLRVAESALMLVSGETHRHKIFHYNGVVESIH